MNNFVRWSELNDTFKRLFPRTVLDVLSTEKAAQVKYLGVTYEIRPVPFRSIFDVEVWGPPFVNHFPSPQHNERIVHA